MESFPGERFCVSHIAHDKYGSVVWQSIDGKNTITDIVRIMEKAFPDETERMLDRQGGALYRDAAKQQIY